jgi:hypothetical protein
LFSLPELKSAPHHFDGKKSKFKKEENVPNINKIIKHI